MFTNTETTECPTCATCHHNNHHLCTHITTHIDIVTDTPNITIIGFLVPNDFACNQWTPKQPPR